MARFPLFIDLTSLTCLVFGGGRVALRKIEVLRRYDARIEVVSAAVDPEIGRLLPPEQIHLSEISVPKEEDLLGPAASGLKAKDPSPDYWLERADLVIAATSDRDVNHYIFTLC
ncbi:MAG: NAD(P)-dependent oxidoreductase, partial [Eubacterium sp.]|nr:NAD(P)-dependent oxidoreductase [Eubacterium sp.]